MYYILAAIAFLLTYYFVMKLVSSLFKSCLVVLGLGLFIGVAYVFITSQFRPVNILDLYVVDQFQIERVSKD